jgi:hypothetical protein
VAWGRYGGKGEVQTAFWCADLRESDHVEDPGVNMTVIVKWVLKKSVGTAWMD